MKRTLRGTAAAAIVALPLMLAACTSDNTEESESNGSTGTSSTETGSEMADSSDSTSANGSTDSASMPFGPGCSALPADGPGSLESMETKPVATAASENPELSTLVTAVQAAGLAETLNTTEDITVFAPTNDAFAALPKETLDAALADPSGLLTSVLTNHAVEGQVAPDDVVGDYTTLGGGTITVSGSGEDYMVEEANVVCGNVKTANATVYIIDQVLLPA